jgi:hypothetical protein
MRKIPADEEFVDRYQLQTILLLDELGERGNSGMVSFKSALPAI